MDKQIIIDNIEYNNYIEMEPDFKKGDLNNFKMYYKIFIEDFKKLKMNTLISYNIENKIYNTGFILKFIEPNIFILKDIHLLYIWSIRIEEDTMVYVKDLTLFRKENKIKNLLFEKFKNEN
tara:strand:+ start:418 stop:780 length:363 start_codon:yes stop_codon:yes gene_type:complete